MVVYVPVVTATVLLSGWGRSLSPGVWSYPGQHSQIPFQKKKKSPETFRVQTKIYGTFLGEWGTKAPNLSSCVPRKFKVKHEKPSKKNFVISETKVRPKQRTLSLESSNLLVEKNEGKVVLLPNVLCLMFAKRTGVSSAVFTNQMFNSFATLSTGVYDPSWSFLELSWWPSHSGGLHLQVSSVLIWVLGKLHLCY